MIGPLLLVLASASPATEPPTLTSIAVAPAAKALFERDWVLMNWALKFHDTDGDILLEPSEAQAAAKAFRQMADTDGDGRITPQEYRSARELILSRH